MNIDERLELLTRSAEAHNLQIAAHDRQIEALLQLAAKHDNGIDKLKARWDDIAEGIARLVHTAEMHDRRMDGHEERLDNLEG
jgi:chromosome segregation ATPase